MLASSSRPRIGCEGGPRSACLFAVPTWSRRFRAHEEKTSLQRGGRVWVRRCVFAPTHSYARTHQGVGPGNQPHAYGRLQGSIRYEVTGHHDDLMPPQNLDRLSEDAGVRCSRNHAITAATAASAAAATAAVPVETAEAKQKQLHVQSIHRRKRVLRSNITHHMRVKVVDVQHWSQVSFDHHILPCSAASSFDMSFFVAGPSRRVSWRAGRMSAAGRQRVGNGGGACACTCGACV